MPGSSKADLSRTSWSVFQNNRAAFINQLVHPLGDRLTALVQLFIVTNKVWIKKNDWFSSVQLLFSFGEHTVFCCTSGRLLWGWWCPSSTQIARWAVAACLWHEYAVRMAELLILPKDHNVPFHYKHEFKVDVCFNKLVFGGKKHFTWTYRCFLPQEQTKSPGSEKSSRCVVLVLLPAWTPCLWL